MHLSYEVMLADEEDGGVMVSLVIAEDVEKEGEGMAMQTIALGSRVTLDGADEAMGGAVPSLRRTSDWTYDVEGTFPFHWCTAVCAANIYEGSTV